jgi:hypothetical protein
MKDLPEGPDVAEIPNGSGAAAVLAAGVGCFALAALGFAGDKWPAVKTSLNFYRPTGPLSGVTTMAIVLWLLTWGVMEWRWRERTIGAGRVSTIALILLGLSFLLTFPPLVDLL